MAIQRAAPSAAMVCSGCACRSRLLPAATPMRRVPKSKARKERCVGRAGAMGGCSSGMPGVGAQHPGVDAEQLQRALVALLRRCVEDHLRLRIHGEPAVAADLVLEL